MNLTNEIARLFSALKDKTTDGTLIWNESILETAQEADTISYYIPFGKEKITISNYNKYVPGNSTDAHFTIFLTQTYTTGGPDLKLHTVTSQASIEHLLNSIVRTTPEALEKYNKAMFNLRVTLFEQATIRPTDKIYSGEKETQQVTK